MARKKMGEKTTLFLFKETSLFVLLGAVFMCQEWPFPRACWDVVAASTFSLFILDDRCRVRGQSDASRRPDGDLGNLGKSELKSYLLLATKCKKTHGGLVVQGGGGAAPGYKHCYDEGAIAMLEFLFSLPGSQTCLFYFTLWTVQAACVIRGFGIHGF